MSEVLKVAAPYAAIGVVDAVSQSQSQSQSQAEAEPQPPLRPVAGFVTAGHEVLFQDSEVHRCDVCAGMLDKSFAQARNTDREGDEGDAGGRGLLVWSRGEERRYQEPPLCAACATAIGVSALQRWEIEEEEG